MQINVKSWLETTLMKVSQNRFLTPPPLPYVVFLADATVGGADGKNNVAIRQISVELYSKNIDLTAEQKIENLLDAISYSKSTIWIQTEMFFQTVYDFELIEKL